jgi:flagellar protein FliJ
MLKMKTESKNPALEAALRMKDRQVADLEIAISEFEHSASLLDQQIRVEECRTGITDPTNPAYSSFAKSAIQRRNNLRASAASLKVGLEAVLHERNALMQQLSG